MYKLNQSQSYILTGLQPHIHMSRAEAFCHQPNWDISALACTHKVPSTVNDDFGTIAEPSSGRGEHEHGAGNLFPRTRSTGIRSVREMFAAARRADLPLRDELSRGLHWRPELSLFI